jgi:hypothetical protein
MKFEYDIMISSFLYLVCGFKPFVNQDEKAGDD